MQNRAQAVNRVYSISLVFNLIMLSLKLSVGFLTGSLVMIADGLDSSLDAVANIIAMVVTRIAGRPPDDDHPYGHRRYETLAAMMVGGFLLLTASEIVKNSISRLLSGETPDLGLPNFVVMMLALVVNLGLFSLQRREGKRLHSEVLIASSQDKRSDIMVSITALISLATVQLGLGWVDAVAALVVVMLIGRNAFGIIKQAASILVDHVALDAAVVSQIVLEVPSVEQVVRVRSRGSEDDVHLELLVRVAPLISIEHSAAIAEEIGRRLRAQFTGLVTIDVNFLPAHELPPDYAQIAEAEAVALGVRVHEIAIAAEENGIAFDAHVEVDDQQTLDSAHAIVSRFEDRLMHVIPDLTNVVTHIEPAYGAKPCVHCDSEAEQLSQSIMHMVNQLYPDGRWHDLVLRAEPDGGYFVSIHCQLRGSMMIVEAHQMAEQVETQLRMELPEIHRITIHTEPLESETQNNPAAILQNK
jgi:cation diffusion facilitator family transporter